jgi:hypothetical protein
LRFVHGAPIALRMEILTKNVGERVAGDAS